MGAGRKTETIPVSTKQQIAPMPLNTSVSARNLRQGDIGGVIFGCTHNTMKECLSKQLFGLPSLHISYVGNIKPGLPLFLFNYSDRKLHGIYEAASDGQMNIDPYAWTDGGTRRTSFPAQVRICIKKQCLPLLENQFKKVIEDNYYHYKHFWFELDHAQVEGLKILFKPCTVPLNIKQVPAVSKQENLSKTVPATNWKITAHAGHMNTEAAVTKDANSFAVLIDPNKFGSANWADWDVELASSSKTSTSAPDDSEIKEQISDWEYCDETASNSQFGIHPVPCGDNQNLLDESPGIKGAENSNDAVVDLHLDGGSRIVLEESLRAKRGETLQEYHSGSDDVRLEANVQKLNAISIKRECSSPSFNDYSDDSSGLYMPEKVQGEANFSKESFDLAFSRGNTTISCQYEGSAKLVQIIEQLAQKTATLEKKQAESDQEIQILRDVVKESGRKIRQLEYQVEVLESNFSSSMSLHGGTSRNTVTLTQHASEEAIYLIGGYNGTMWLSSLDSFSPSLDELASLKPMSCSRSYAAAATLDDNIFVFGGGDGSSWYNTVECYNKRNDEWTMCPRLNHAKVSLAGATMSGKIFAIGGGDGLDSFSDVEMFDPALGKWIYSPSMLQRRFAPAAAEFHGVLYTVGGYDGNNYLQSAERYDPREGYWTRLPSMNTRRGSHSLAVLNEKMYAMGGYDGEKMVSSVEAFDPRLGSWMMDAPMNCVRGYGAAVVLNDAILIIGGLNVGENLVDSVECYNERTGWSILGTKSIGKRCFFSATVLLG
ncbi:uncharacterized protein [Typha angustifolia]|uniref:uncharacterized protein n=1 Tax=Typha angustifolia TaxID=59011 RepID=UPI003C2FB52E